MSNHEYRVVIIEQDYELLKLYWSVIDRMLNFKVVSVYNDSLEAIRRIAKDEPNIIVVSYYLEKDPTDILELLSKKSARLEIVALTNFIDSSWISKAIANGVSGIILKSKRIVELEKALVFVVNGGSYLSPAIVKKFVSANKKNLSSPLSPREMEVLQLMSRGKTYSMIAGELNISKETSRSHMKNIYSKLSVSSKSAAILLAKQQRII